MSNTRSVFEDRFGPTPSDGMTDYGHAIACLYNGHDAATLHKMVASRALIRRRTKGQAAVAIVLHDFNFDRDGRLIES